MRGMRLKRKGFFTVTEQSCHFITKYSREFFHFFIPFFSCSLLLSYPFPINVYHLSSSFSISSFLLSPPLSLLFVTEPKVVPCINESQKERIGCWNKKTSLFDHSPQSLFPLSSFSPFFLLISLTFFFLFFSSYFFRLLISFVLFLFPSLSLFLFFLFCPSRFLLPVTIPFSFISSPKRS